jgi:hypothetical protein
VVSSVRYIFTSSAGFPPLARSRCDFRFFPHISRSPPAAIGSTATPADVIEPVRQPVEIVELQTDEVAQVVHRQEAPYLLARAPVAVYFRGR